MMNQHDSSFPRLDRVIRSQRRAVALQRFVSVAFIAGAFAAASSLTGCAADTDEDLRNRDYVTDTVDGWGTPLPAGPDDGLLASLRAEVLEVMPDAIFEVEDADAAERQVMAIIVARGTLEIAYMGVPAGEATLRFEVVTIHDRLGHVIELRRRLLREEAALRRLPGLE
jgi:hypothetical protein